MRKHWHKQQVWCKNRVFFLWKSDRDDKPDEYLNEYCNFLDLVIKINPKANMIVLGAFCGYCADNLTRILKNKYNL